MIRKRSQILYLVLSAGSLGLSVLYTAMLARFLGGELYGRYAVLIHVGFLLTPLTALVPNLIFSLVHSGEERSPSLGAFVRFFLVLATGSFPLAYLVLSVFPIATDASSTQKFLALLSLYANVFLLIHQSFFQTRNQYPRFLSQQIAAFALKALGAVVIFSLFVPFTIEWALTINFLGTLAWITFSGRDLRERTKMSEAAILPKSFLKYLENSKRILLPSLLLTFWALLLHSLDILMAQKVFTAADLSVYAVISSISKVTLILPSVVTPLVLEFGYKNRAIGEVPASAMVSSMALTLVIGLFISLLGHLLAPWLMPFLFQRDFAFQGWSVPLLVLAMSFLAMLSFYVHYDFGRGRYWPLGLSLATLACIFGIFLYLPRGLSLIQYSGFIFAWPILNFTLLFIRSWLTRAATRNLI